MEALVFGYYLGLLVFALNGLIWMGMRQERYVMKARDDRLRKLLMARRPK